MSARLEINVERVSRGISQRDFSRERNNGGEILNCPAFSSELLSRMDLRSDGTSLYTVFIVVPSARSAYTDYRIPSVHLIVKVHRPN